MSSAYDADPTPRTCGFDEFFYATYPRHVIAVHYVLGDRAAAEDLVSAAYTRAWASWERIENPYTWITAVVYRAAAAHRPAYHRWQRRLAQVGVTTCHDAQRDPVEIAQGREDYEKVCAALAQLPRHQAVAAVMRWVLELPVEQIAQQLGCSPSAVHTHLRRARDKLHRQFGSGGELLNFGQRDMKGEAP